jgi:hypothetical protein
MHAAADAAPFRTRVQCLVACHGPKGCRLESIVEVVAITGASSGKRSKRSAISGSAKVGRCRSGLSAAVLR